MVGPISETGSHVISALRIQHPVRVLVDSHQSHDMSQHSVPVIYGEQISKDLIGNHRSVVVSRL